METFLDETLATEPQTVFNQNAGIYTAFYLMAMGFIFLVIPHAGSRRLILVIGSVIGSYAPGLAYITRFNIGAI